MSLLDDVRVKTADRSVLRKENFVGDGVSTSYKLKENFILTAPALKVYLNTVLQVAGYTVDSVYGYVNFTVAPGVGVAIAVEYFWAVFTDAEITGFLTEAGNNTDYAAAKMLLAWAASASKLAMRETLSGGGGIGAVTRDTSLAARELRETAAALMQMYGISNEGATFPAEGLTETPWTEQGWNRLVDQDLIRNL